jgi:hypothetical protein
MSDYDAVYNATRDQFCFMSMDGSLEGAVKEAIKEAVREVVVGHLTKQLAELDAAPSDPLWLDISTAPKDGSLVLLSWAGTNEISRATWHNGMNQWADSTAGVLVVFDAPPTHWMPVQLPPKK